MSPTRRDLLTAAGALALAPAAAAAQTAAAPAALTALLDDFVEARLRLSPELATNLGLDTGARAALRARLSDNSLAARDAARRLAADQLARLQRIDRAGLTPAEQVDYDTIAYTCRTAIAFNPFAYGDGTSPYSISQQDGAYQDTPDFLDTKHPIASRGDVEAYLSRMRAFAGALAQDTARQRLEAEAGVIAPDFVLDKALTQMRALRTPAATSGMIASVVRRAASANLDIRPEAEATRIWDRDILPALNAQIAQTEQLRARAGHTAGVGRLPNGEAYYAACLRAHTTTGMTPQEVHRLGREQAAEISGRIDTLLRARGLTQGTVGARIRGLYADPAQHFANTDAGKVELIAFCNERQQAIVGRLPQAFERLPPYRFEIRRVPPAIEAGAASAYAQGASLDGTRPGIVYINLADTAEWPRWSLSSVTYHEGLPGHQLEGGLALSNTRLPLIRKMTGFAAYAEGWALYAEQLADELGIYADDPLSQVGYLRFQLFRALRCVADTGLHAMGWTYEQAIALFVDEDGDAPGFATREVERYCVNPGQACSYKIGHTVWLRARQRAQTALGPRFDIKAFHTAGLGAGRCPLDVLDGVVDRYVVSART